MLEDMARRYGLLALLLALVFVVLISENGIFDYLKLKRQINVVDTSIRRLEDENVVLRKKIDRVQKDDRYLEDLAREKYGLIGEGEKVYRIEK